MINKPNASDSGLDLPTSWAAAFALSEADRARLSPAALVAMRALAACWRLTDGEAADLFGMSGALWGRIRCGDHREPLSLDQMARVSALLGVYCALHALFVGDMADHWVRLPNTGPVFGGDTPIQMMVERGYGRVVNISSRSSDMVQTAFVAYAAGKAALNMVTRNLAAELAPKVRVNAISVGGVDTDALTVVLQDERARRVS